MTNNVVAFDYNGVKVVVDDDTTILDMSMTSVSGYLSFVDPRTGTSYQVPTGKKARIIYATAIPLGDSGNKIGTTTAADASTGFVTWRIYPGIALANKIYVSPSAAAGLYITVFEDAAEAYTITVLEESAT